MVSVSAIRTFIIRIDSAIWLLTKMAAVPLHSVLHQLVR